MLVIWMNLIKERRAKKREREREKNLYEIVSTLSFIIINDTVTEEKNVEFMRTCMCVWILANLRSGLDEVKHESTCKRKSANGNPDWVWNMSRWTHTFYCTHPHTLNSRVRHLELRRSWKNDIFIWFVIYIKQHF